MVRFISLLRYSVLITTALLAYPIFSGVDGVAAGIAQGALEMPSPPSDALLPLRDDFAMSPSVRLSVRWVTTTSPEVGYGPQVLAGSSWKCETKRALYDRNSEPESVTVQCPHRNHGLYVLVMVVWVVYFLLLAIVHTCAQVRSYPATDWRYVVYQDAWFARRPSAFLKYLGFLLSFGTCGIAVYVIVKQPITVDRLAPVLPFLITALLGLNFSTGITEHVLEWQELEAIGPIPVTAVPPQAGCLGALTYVLSPAQLMHDLVRLTLDTGNADMTLAAVTDKPDVLGAVLRKILTEKKEGSDDMPLADIMRKQQSASMSLPPPAAAVPMPGAAAAMVAVALRPPRTRRRCNHHRTEGRLLPSTPRQRLPPTSPGLPRPPAKDCTSPCCPSRVTCDAVRLVLDRHRVGWDDPVCPAGASQKTNRSSKVWSTESG